jgi:hypothetical protein
VFFLFFLCSGLDEVVVGLLAVGMAAVVTVEDTVVVVTVVTVAVVMVAAAAIQTTEEAVVEADMTFLTAVDMEINSAEDHMIPEVVVAAVPTVVAAVPTAVAAVPTAAAVDMAAAGMFLVVRHSSCSVFAMFCLCSFHVGVHTTRSLPFHRE